MSHVSQVRRAARAAQVPESDRAALELALAQARLLDEVRPKTLTQIAAGEKPLSLEDQLEIIRIVGPQHLRTLTALGLTRAGRGAVPASAIPTIGAPAGASADSAAHDRHRQRFSERAG